MPRIELKELAVRESEQVEWKENVADLDSVIKTVVAFSNDYSNLGGGYVVCGAAESRDEHGFSRMAIPGLGAARLKEIEGKVMAACRQSVDPPVVPLVEELPAGTPDRRVLVFIVPATPHAHCFRAHGKDASTYYIRVSRETVEAKNGLLRELLVRKRAVDPWDRRVHPSATAADLDPLALRGYLQRTAQWDPARPFEDYLSPEVQIAALAVPLCAREPLTQTIRPRNFALLLFGRQPTRFFPGAYAVLSLYPGKDRGEPYAERHQLDGTLIDQATRLISSLNTEAYAIFDKTAAAPNLLKYPQRALHEAVVNALVHRDYESDQPSRVTVFSDRIEVYSPGPLPSAVDRTRFEQGLAPPFWRNQALAYFVNKLQLAQAEGQGIPTILGEMRREGCPPPEFEMTPEHLTCVLQAHPRHELIAALREIERDLILGHREEAAQRAAGMLERDPYNARAMALFCESNSLLGTPQQLYDFLEAHRIDPRRLNAATQLLIAETLAPARAPAIQRLARDLLHQASQGRLQEAETRRLIANLRKLGLQEEAIAAIDKAFAALPTLSTDPTLLRHRGEALMSMARRCSDTARSRGASARIKDDSWQEFQGYLREARRDLLLALEHAGSQVERGFIERDIRDLDSLQKSARRAGPQRSR